EPALHVGDARTIGPAVDDLERPAPRLALREDGVAVTHEEDGLEIAAGAGEFGPQGVAVGLAAPPGRRDAVIREEAGEALAHRIDAGLVVAAAVDVHHLFEKCEHLALPLCQPAADGLLGLGASRHRSHSRQRWRAR